MEPVPDEARFAALKEGYEMAASAGADATTPGVRRSVRNRQPVAIVASRAFIPADLRTCSPRASDILFPRGRDVAVLLDVSTSAEKQDFIAVWYQRDVSPGELLTFQDLLVYSSDAWDAKYPPYFRLRLVDVSAERNTAVGALLGQIRSSSDTITSMIGAAGAAPIVSIGALAADQVLANDHNRSLVDFTFQLYGAHLLGEAGGMPLGVLQTGGMLITAPPCGETNDYWSHSYQYDHRLNRVLNDAGVVQSSPFILTTVLTADLAVPQIVRTRSNEIVRRLTDPQVVQSELGEAQQDAAKLVNALGALSEREAFRRRPSKEAFKILVERVGRLMPDLDAVEAGFLLDAFYQTTGSSQVDADGYAAWLTRCSAAAAFNEESARFVVDKAVKGTDGAPCWI
ncbi:hypothetical protein [Brevundimonas nasdae]|uniref:DUF4214 domain-containing protein n=1 Tax=Brevundimonas nasdae TaxID=172043 RepID=A0ABX8TJW2_9CAUL|nr:hypothetical protein [Brevundimonas nasdae]QYC11513.1 hypothetical protein KWG56_05925 [Brevundimonas nasdae]QYC14301.1 hypothetical protein KWG63_01260 [Brevundimonas nasdae]